MKCHRCNKAIIPEDSHDYGGQTLCDDCYMDALSPPRSCDPWAVHSAKKLEECSPTGLELNETQTRIVQLLEDLGEAEPAMICERLGVKPDELQREIAALRHMERVRGRKTDGGVVVCLW